MYSRITGTGSYLPEKVLDNHELEKMLDTTDEWIRERTGIKKLHVAVEGETTCDLAEKAARNAVDMAGRNIEDIDLIIVATTTPDRIFPSTACLLQQRLDIHGCTAFDIQAVCTGFVYALGVADNTCGAAFTAATGVGAGQFLLKSVSGAFSSGKIALVVAGYETADTAAAAEYLMTQTVDTASVDKVVTSSTMEAVLA